MSNVAGGCFGRTLQLLAPQPRVDLPRRPLAVPDPDRDRALGGHHVAAREHARAPGHQRARHPDGAVRLELHPRHRAQEARCRSPARAPGSPCRPPSVSKRPVGCGNPDSSSSITSTCSCSPSNALIVRSQLIRTPSRSASSRLLLVRRHLLPGAAVDDQRLLRAQPPRGARRVHRRVPAAVDRHAPPDRRPLPRRHPAQERHRVDHRPRVHRGDLHPLGQMRADRHEHRVKAALVALGLEIGDAMVAGEPHAQRRDPLDLAARARRGAAGRPGSRSASSRPARRRHRGSRPHGRAVPGDRRPRARWVPRR